MPARWGWRVVTVIDACKDFLKNELKEGDTLYAIVDSGIYKAFHDMMDVEGEENIRILLKEPYLQGYETAAPYLMLLDIDDAITNGLLHAAAGEHWLTLIVSRKSLDALAQELRDMIVVESEMHARHIIYRFYDPRNLTDYINIHSEEELTELYEDIGGALFTVDADDPGVVYAYRPRGAEMIDLKEEV